MANTLESIREDIDKLDYELVELMAKRTKLIREVSTFKNSVEEVKADDRIEFIKQRVRHRAIELGVSPNMVSELFTIMINEMVETEIAELRNAGAF